MAGSPQQINQLLWARIDKKSKIKATLGWEKERLDGKG